jgi:transposase
MRGDDLQRSAMFSYLSPEERVPANHPLRSLRELTDRVLQSLSATFDAMYSKMGRRPVAPAKLLRALLLQILYTIRSGRMLMEQLNYNLLFRWFVGLNMDDPVWDETVYTKNRERLWKAGVARKFFELVWEAAKTLDWVSNEHLAGDGTLREACASLKSFKKVEGKAQQAPDDPGNRAVNFHGEKRRHDTHRSTADPDALLARKGKGKEAKLGYAGHVWMENRKGLAVDAMVTQATGTAERDAALLMAEAIPGEQPVTPGADKNYDSKDFVAQARNWGATPHVAQNGTGRRSAMDGGTTRHAG